MHYTSHRYRIPEPRPATLAIAAGAASAALLSATGWATTTHNLRQRTRELHHAQAEYHAAQRALEDAQHDHVTGLLTRRAWQRQVEKLRHHTHHVVFGLIDMNDFKTINDQYGHRVGDVVLHTTARRLRMALGSHALISRYGGDEMVFLTTQPVNPNRLRARLAQPVHVAKVGDVIVGAAIGTTAPGPETSTVEALEEADAIMYAAKRRSRSHRHAPASDVSSRSGHERVEVQPQ